MPANSSAIKAGELRHRIDLVKVSNVQDSTGGFDLSADVIYSKVWAKIETLSGSESSGAGSEVSVVQKRVTIRFIGAAPSWRANNAYPAGALIKDQNGYLQQAQFAGTSGATAPAFSQTEGQFTNDGDPSTGTEWKNVGVAPEYTGVTSALQIWFRGQQWQVTSVQNPDERNKKLILTAVVINDGRQQLPPVPRGLI